MDATQKVEYVGLPMPSFIITTPQDTVSQVTINLFDEQQPLISDLDLKNKDVKEILKSRVSEGKEYLDQRRKILKVYSYVLAGFLGASGCAFITAFMATSWLPFWVAAPSVWIPFGGFISGMLMGTRICVGEHFNNEYLAEELSYLKTAVKNLDRPSFMKFCQSQDYENLEELLEIMEFHFYVISCIELKKILKAISKAEIASEEELKKVEFIKTFQNMYVEEIEKKTGLPFKRFEIETEEYMNV